MRDDTPTSPLSQLEEGDGAKAIAPTGMIDLLLMISPPSQLGEGDGNDTVPPCPPPPFVVGTTRSPEPAQEKS